MTRKPDGELYRNEERLFNIYPQAKESAPKQKQTQSTRKVAN